ncbi:hypothetical protein PTTG_30700, partial [Puccinia triticina 1-1 BBBD Race 1]
ALTGLFEVVEHRSFVCKSAQPCLAAQIRSLTPIKIELKNFLENGITPSDVTCLLNLWTTTGISKTPGLVCRCDSINASTEPKPKARGRPKKVKSQSPDITISTEQPNGSSLTAEYVQETSRLAFKDDLPPQHLYFFMEVTQPSDPIERERYMGAMDWPHQISISGVKFTLFSRGYWNGSHYWCKVVRSGRGSTTGVWLHDDRQNDGYARLVNTDISSIGGCHPFTSWLFYTRAWTTSEQEFINDSIAKISKDHPNAEGDIPFVHLASMINSQHHPPSAKAATVLDEGNFVTDFDDLGASDSDEESTDNLDQKNDSGDQSSESSGDKSLDSSGDESSESSGDEPSDSNSSSFKDMKNKSET